MRTIQVVVYTYDELSPDAQARARDWYRTTVLADPSWADPTVAAAVKAAGYLGLSIANTRNGSPAIWWTMHVQGSGVSFDGRWRSEHVDFTGLCREYPDDPELPAIGELADSLYRWERATATVKSSRRGHVLDIDYEAHDEDEPAKFPAETLSEVLKRFTHWVYEQLDARWDAINSDAAIADALMDAEYEFTADGQRAGV